MLRIISLIPLLLLLGCSKSISDSDKFIEFNNRCAELSSEFITDDSALGAVNLSDRAFGISGKVASQKNIKATSNAYAPIGEANLPALDIEYRPLYLLKTLFIPPEPIDEVRFSYRHKNGASEIQKCYENTRIVVRSAEEAESTFLNKCDAKRTKDANYLGRYNILYAYGEVDKYEIRPFMFWVNDRESGRVLAQQVSFQLLLGGMSSENKAAHGWGSSQGVKTCRLTPPDQVIKRVFR